MIKKNLAFSIIIPVYKSESTLLELNKRLHRVLNKIDKQFEIIFVDDASPDNSWDILCKIFHENKRVRLIQLTRNFGQHNAIMCGFAHIRGKYVITLDDDLQNPPEEIIKLVNKMREGYDLVYGEYQSRQHTAIRNIGSNLVQFVYKNIFHVHGNLTSFRIIKSTIIEELLKYKRNYTFIDGLLAWQTRNIGYVSVKHEARKAGKSNYNFMKLFILTLNMVTNFSIFPLQIASIGGFGISLLGFLLAYFYFFKKILFGIPVTGFTSIIIAILIFSGVQLITIGLIGEYIGRIHLNINEKPQYTIRSIKDR